MTQKAMGNVQKLSTIYCCMRESLSHMMKLESDQDGALGVNFLVLPVDVEAAWELVQQSMHTFKHFKVSNQVLSILSTELPLHRSPLGRSFRGRQQLRVIIKRLLMRR